MTESVIVTGHTQTQFLTDIVHTSWEVVVMIKDCVAADVMTPNSYKFALKFIICLHVLTLHVKFTVHSVYYVLLFMDHQNCQH